MTATASGAGSTGRVAVGLASLGVVFGDIGTSPLYALQAVFAADALHPLAVDRTTVYGVVSLVVWTITLIVTISYVALIMRADDAGEGGILSLVALLTRGRRPGRGTAVLGVLGLAGAALFLGDSVITPAISVLSAVEGLEISRPGLAAAVVPAAVVILVVLFAAQHLGTGRVGAMFGPVMAIWFALIAACGLRAILDHPGILAALSPTWALHFCARTPAAAFLSLGGIVLAVTGAEALFADMGHFGRAPIRVGWFAVVAPALLLNYLGQGALLLSDPAGRSNPFFLLVPDQLRLPTVLLATAATVIASQAVISGAFTVAHQADRLGYLPHLRIKHTSTREPRQIYAPLVNWTMAVAVLVLVLSFRSSQSLASAYGIAVTATITLTTALFLCWARLVRGWSIPAVLALGVVLLGTDLTILASNSLKIMSGGWLPLVLAAAVFLVFTTWHRGSELVAAARDKLEGPLQEFVDAIHARPDQVRRVPGTAVYLSRSPGQAPLALHANVEHNQVLHRQVIIVTVVSSRRPRVPAAERVRLDDLGHPQDGICQLSVQFGYRERPHLVPALAAGVPGLEGGLPDLDQIRYFVSTHDLVATDRPGLAPWRKRLFTATATVAADPVATFALPRTRTVTMGAQIEF